MNPQSVVDDHLLVLPSLVEICVNGQNYHNWDDRKTCGMAEDSQKKPIRLIHIRRYSSYTAITWNKAVTLSSPDILQFTEADSHES